MSRRGPRGTGRAAARPRPASDGSSSNGARRCLTAAAAVAPGGGAVDDRRRSSSGRRRAVVSRQLGERADADRAQLGRHGRAQAGDERQVVVGPAHGDAPPCQRQTAVAAGARVGRRHRGRRPRSPSTAASRSARTRRSYAAASTASGARRRRATCTSRGSCCWISTAAMRTDTAAGRRPPSPGVRAWCRPARTTTAPGRSARRPFQEVGVAAPKGPSKNVAWYTTSTPAAMAARVSEAACRTSIDPRDSGDSTIRRSWAP